MLEMNQQQLPEQRQQMKVSSHLVTFSEFLQLSSLELEALISLELSDNPALELVETPRCEECGTELLGSICPRCLSRQKVGDVGADDWNAPGLDERAGSMQQDDDLDVWGRVAAQATLSERLLLQLYAMLPASQHPIAEYLVGSLDDEGYLRGSLGEIAEALQVERGEVQAVLGQLQSLDPAGVGARNLRECLLIQLGQVEQEDGRSNPLAREILELGLLDELGAHRYGRLAAILGAGMAEVQVAAAFISAELTPSPARQQWDREPGARPARAARVRPDVLISREADQFLVEVVESRRFSLQVAPSYRGMLGEIERVPEQYSAADRQHVRDYVNRSKLFLDNIRQRRATMRTIAEVVVEEQDAFLRHGLRALKPLTRAHVAGRISVHESTVSRATNRKYVMLPTTRVLPMADFFTANLAPKDVLRAVLREAPGLNDAAIVDVLATKHGIRLARRTVAKYRNALGILPAKLR